MCVCPMQPKETMKVKLHRLSICECGFPILKDGIPIGTVYHVNPSIMISVKFVCGGCGREQIRFAVLVERREGCKHDPGFLPGGIFKVIPATITDPVGGTMAFSE